MMAGFLKALVCGVFAYLFARLWVDAIILVDRFDSTALNVSIFLAPITFCGWRAGSYLLRGRS